MYRKSWFPGGDSQLMMLLILPPPHVGNNNTKYINHNNNTNCTNNRRAKTRVQRLMNKNCNNSNFWAPKSQTQNIDMEVGNTKCSLSGFLPFGLLPQQPSILMMLQQSSCRCNRCTCYECCCDCPSSFGRLLPLAMCD
jgi:hypothetical protein